MAFELYIDGRTIQNESSFHEAVDTASGIGYYGRNLNALWDLLTGLVDAPIHIQWTSAALSKAVMEQDFELIIGVIREAEERYRNEWPNEEFNFELVM